MSDQNLDTLIRAHVGRREYAAAQDLCLQWRAHVPDSPDALRMSGEIALLVGDVAGAIAFYREGDVLLPSWLTKISLAYAHLLRREYAEAEAVCRSTLAIPLTERHAANTQEMLKDIALVQSVAPIPEAQGHEETRDAWEQTAVAAMDTLQPHGGLSVVFFHVTGSAHPFLKVPVDYTAVLLRSMQAARA